MSGDSLTDTIQSALESVDDTDLIRVVPYFSAAQKAYRFVARRRLALFLVSLQESQRDLSEEERARFDGYVNSVQGRELLGDYAETARRSRSETVIASLGILFGDPHSASYDDAFKAEVATAFDGLSESRVQAFLLIHKHQNQLPKVPDGTAPFPVYSLSSGRCPDALAAWSPNAPAEWLGAIHDLFVRGLLKPDTHAGSRWGDETESWRIAFGVDENTKRFARLLTRAREYLGRTGE